jgi:hypothetical protein
MAQRRRDGRRQRRSGRGGVNKNTQAIIILVVALVLLGGFLTTYFLAKEDASHISQDFCRADPMPEMTAVVIDHTDKINTIQKADLERRLWDIANNLDKNGKIQFFSVEKVGNSVLQPGLSLCNPGSEKEVSEWSGNKRLARKHYEEKFASLLKEKLEDILNAPTATTSPIMEATQSVVVTAFTGNSNTANKKKLVLVSDLLEHADGFSVYKGAPDFDDYRKGGHWSSVRADMSGIEVVILFLNRPGAENIQKRNLQKFWMDYFYEQGAKDVKFLLISG